jgi:signal transduction histidine kinase
VARRVFWPATTLVIVALLLVPRGVLLPANPVAKAVFDTLMSTMSVITAGFFVIRFREDRATRDLVCGFGFALIGLSSLVLGLNRAADPAGSSYVLGIAFTTRVAGSAILGLAAFELLRRRRITRGIAAAAVTVTVLGIAVVAWLVAGELPVSTPGGPVLALDIPHTPWRVVIGHLAVVVALGAGVRVWRSIALVDGDEVARWMARGLGLLLIARLYLTLYPGAPSGWFHVGELARFAGHAVILVAVTRATFARWRAMAAAAGQEERQQVAGALHDGLAQELALLTSQSRWLAQRSPENSQELDFVATVAQRALDESRRTISALRHGRQGGTASPAGPPAAPPELYIDVPAATQVSDGPLASAG